MKVYITDWFPRTKAHLSELHDFLANKRSHLPLDERRLKSLHGVLDIKSISRNFSPLEHLQIETTNNITVRIYTDGLTVVSTEVIDSPHKSLQLLENYYQDRLMRAYLYLFSLGAPLVRHEGGRTFIIPKIVVIDQKDENRLDYTLKELGFRSDKPMIESENLSMFQEGPTYLFHKKSDMENSVLELLIEEQSFLKILRELLHTYIDLHREIWSAIDSIRTQNSVSGKEIHELNSKIDRYIKLAILIDGRIMQMSIFVETRHTLLEYEKLPQVFAKTMSLSFQTLNDMLSYTRELWHATKNYVEQANSFFDKIETRIANSSVSDLAVVAAIGVGAIIIDLFTKSAPTFSSFGVMYILILAMLGYLSKKAVNLFYKKRKYNIKEFEEEQSE